MKSDSYTGLNNEGTLDAVGRLWFTDENNLNLQITEDDIVEGNESLDIQLYQPVGNLYLGGERISIGPALGRGLPGRGSRTRRTGARLEPQQPPPCQENSFPQKQCWRLSKFALNQNICLILRRQSMFLCQF